MKKLLLIIFIILFFCVFLFGCKKKAPENGTGINEFSSIDYEQGYGILEVMKVEELVGGNLYPHGSSPSLAHSYFYDSLTYYNYMGGSNAQDIGSVSLNGIGFKKYSWFNTFLSTVYFDTIKSGFSFPLNWKIVGNNNFNSYSLQIAGDYPTFSGYSTLPDTIFLSNGVTIPLNNISGDQIQIFIDDNAFTYTMFKFLDKPFTSVSFTSSEFVPFMNTNYGNITIVVYKNNLRTLNNRVYNFRTGYQLIKRNVVLAY